MAQAELLSLLKRLLRQQGRQQTRTLSRTAILNDQTMRYRRQEHGHFTDAENTASLPVIRFPQAMVAKMNDALHKKQKVESERRQQKWAMEDLRVIIQSKRPERNFRAGQSTNKFEAPLLASQSWKHKRSGGDYFIIKPFGNNPAMIGCEQDAVPGFEKFHLQQPVRDALRDMELTVCTNIQNQAIPIMLQGDNVICAAETGSGKTLAYLVPLVDKLNIRSELERELHPEDALRVNTPRALILLPNRELACQVYESLLKMLRHTELNAELIIGGERTQRKLNHPTYNATDVLVSTPGVLSKLLTNRVQNVAQVHTVVIDEADTMMDDSFSDTVRRILSQMNIQGGGSGEDDPRFSRGAQLILAGATMPRSIEDTFQGIVPVESLVRVATKHLHKFAPHVKQTFYRTKPGEKSTMILDLVKKSLQAGQTMMIFCRDSATSGWLSRFLQENGLVAPALNGEMLQKFRRGVYDQFQRGEFRCLVCTDIASRGLDTTFVSHIVNYNFPQDISDYIHRTGRTGRLGASERGQVTSYVTYPDEVDVVHKIERAVRDATQFENVNANITRRINIKHGMTEEDLKAAGKMKANSSPKASASLL